MCGIAGIFAGHMGIINSDLLKSMTRSLAHRGPDGEGLWIGQGVGFGHRRLSIIDPTPRGHQPMVLDNGNWVICYNGEVYNYRELRTELENQGVTFHSGTDTEVILRLYERHGIACVRKLRGMFAFGIWDERERTLVLARDRLGIKPLFLARTQEGLLFASEIGALLQDKTLPREMNHGSLASFLATRYVPTPETLLSCVTQLPANCIRVYRDPDQYEDTSYWEIPIAQGNLFTSVHEAEDAVYDVLDNAVKCHLIADVPVGAFLSGGLDSTTLVACAAKHQTINTFTAGFSGTLFDESEAAHNNAQALGVSNACIHCNAPSPDLLEKILSFAQEPTADPAMIPFYDVCGLANRSVKVALSGEGADEVFAGYETYVASGMAQKMGALPRAIRSSLYHLSQRLQPSADKPIGTKEKARRFLHGIQTNDFTRHLRWRQICHEDVLSEILSRDEIDAFAWAIEPPKDISWLDACQWTDLTQYMPNILLPKVDRMSMAQGLEVRVPYLDHHVIETAFRLPPSMRVRHGTKRKWMLHRVARRLWQSKEKSKRGFSVPLAQWIRGPWHDFVFDVLSETSLREQNMISPACVQRMLKSHMQRTNNYEHEIFAFLALTLWHRNVMGSQSINTIRYAG